MRPEVGMPNYRCRYSSAYLSVEQLVNAMRAISQVLRDLGVTRVTAMYGFGSCLHGELLYIPMGIPIKTLPYFIEDTLDHRIVEPGEGDLHITVGEKDLMITFCHESDIHIEGEKESMIERFIASEPFSTFDFRTAEAWKKEFSSGDAST